MTVLYAIIVYWASAPYMLWFIKLLCIIILILILQPALPDQNQIPKTPFPDKDSSREIAAHLTAYDWNLFTNIQQMEYIYQLFGRHKFGKIVSNLDILIRRFNEVRVNKHTHKFNTHLYIARNAHVYYIRLWTCITFFTITLLMVMLSLHACVHFNIAQCTCMYRVTHVHRSHGSSTEIYFS